MAVKLFSIVAAVLVALLLVETAHCENEDVVQSDNLLVDNPNIFIPSSDQLGAPSSNLVCSAYRCSKICWELGFRFSRCTIERVCECSNVSEFSEIITED